MNATWVAVMCAGFAVWVWLPPDAMVRLRPGVSVSLPGWAKPLPQGLDSKKRGWIGAGVALAVVVFGWSATRWVVALAPIIAVGVWIGLGRLEPAGVRNDRVKALLCLPQALDLVSTCVRAGQPLRNAVATVSEVMGSPVEDLFKPVMNAISVGMSDADAWKVLRTDPVVGFLARDLSRSAAWGTSVIDVLAQHSTDLRRQGMTQRLAIAKAVGVKSVLPLGLCYLPAFVLLGVVPVVAGGLAGFFS